MATHNEVITVSHECWRRWLLVTETLGEIKSLASNVCRNYAELVEEEETETRYEDWGVMSY